MREHKYRALTFARGSGDVETKLHHFQSHEPPAGEFTREAREQIKAWPGYVQEHDPTIQWALNACDRLDAQQQEIKVLESANKVLNARVCNLFNEIRRLSPERAKYYETSIDEDVKLSKEIVHRLQAQQQEIERLKARQWYLSPECDTPTSPYKGNGLTWIEYAQQEFQRGQRLTAENTKLIEERGHAQNGTHKVLVELDRFKDANDAAIAELNTAKESSGISYAYGIIRRTRKILEQLAPKGAEPPIQNLIIKNVKLKEGED